MARAVCDRRELRHQVITRKDHTGQSIAYINFENRAAVKVSS